MPIFLRELGPNRDSASQGTDVRLTVISGWVPAGVNVPPARPPDSFVRRPAR